MEARAASSARHPRKAASARTRDGGRTWEAGTDIADNIQERDFLLHGKPHVYDEPYDFNDPATLISCWTTPNSGHPECKAWIKLSRDGGASATHGELSS